MSGARYPGVFLLLSFHFLSPCDTKQDRQWVCLSLKSCAEIRVSFILSFLTATLSSLVVILQLLQISVVTGPCDLWLLIIITIIIIITFI